MGQKFTPPKLAKLWRVSADKVLTWIHNGELRAIDASTNRGGRPRYLIDVADIEAFERRRQVVAVPKPATRARRTASDIPEYV